jgi:hypothetical protein
MPDNTNPFDLASLRLDQSYTDGSAVKKVFSTIPVGKPPRHNFIRVHPGEDYRLVPAGIVELKDERETYLVTQTMMGELATEVALVSLYTTINRQGVIRLWPVRLPDPNSRVCAWHTSAQDAAGRAMTRWVRVAANMSLGANDIFEAPETVPEPEWPDLAFAEMVKIAFGGGFIVDRIDHPLIKKLRGSQL